MPTDTKALAQELTDAYARREPVDAPSTRDKGFDLPAAYAVEAELARLGRAAGRTTVGRKVGFANKAMWRVLKLETLVWAHMYDDTVQYATNGASLLSVARMYSPKIEPEIVFRLKRPLVSADLEPAAVLEAVEWLALGFEIIDCVFPDWKFQPADFVASFGLHAALVVGEPRAVEPAVIPTLVEQLPRFKLRLMKNGELVEEGSGKSALRSPAFCLGELAGAIARQAGAEPLAADELISSGTLTASYPIAPGETWRAGVEELDLPDLTIRVGQDTPGTANF
jgi:2-oxo-3-hexenedioate decarboxylase